MTPTAQALAALERANRSRLAQCDRIRELHALPYTASLALARDWLLDPDEVIGAMRLKRLLGGIHRFGPVMVSRAVNRAGVTPGRLNRRVRELTERERRALAEVLVADRRTLA